MARSFDHQRREAIARAKGFRSYRAYRSASDEVRRARTEALRQAAGGNYRGRRDLPALAPAPTRAPKKRAPREFVTPAGRGGSTSDGRFLRAKIKEAADRGDLIAVQVRFRDAEGNHRTKWLDGKSGAQRAAVAAGAEADRGDLAGESNYDGQRPTGPVQWATTPPGRSHPVGFDARDLLDFIVAYGDIWEALFAIWESDYQ